MDNKNVVFPISTLVRFGKGSIWYFGPVIWNSTPAKIRNAKTSFEGMSSFNKNIQKWKPSNWICQLCEEFLGGIGFTNIRE